MFRYFSARHNERLMSKLSRKIICLNTRDQKLIKKYYKTDVDMILPITLEDDFQDADIFDSENYSSKLELLYVGSYLAHNYTGLTWFIEKVMPFVNAHLTIIGKNMENLINRHFWFSFLDGGTAVGQYRLVQDAVNVILPDEIVFCNPEYCVFG